MYYYQMYSIVAQTLELGHPFPGLKARLSGRGLGPGPIRWDRVRYDGVKCDEGKSPVSYTHLTLPTIQRSCRSRWSPYH